MFKSLPSLGWNFDFFEATLDLIIKTEEGKHLEVNVGSTSYKHLSCLGMKEVEQHERQVSKWRFNEKSILDDGGVNGTWGP